MRKDGKKYRYKTSILPIHLTLVDKMPDDGSHIGRAGYGTSVPIMSQSPPYDPLGSYTGKPGNETEMPIQDVDDL